jgi:hypothetical protein
MCRQALELEGRGPVDWSAEAMRCRRPRAPHSEATPRLDRDAREIREGKGVGGRPVAKLGIRVAV